MTLTIGLVTDIHHGSTTGTKIGTAALPLLGEFRDWANGLPLDTVVDLGDRINNVDATQDARLTREVATAFGGFRAPRAHILGNHDNHALSRIDAQEAMGLSFESWSRDVAGHHLVFWNADTHVTGDGLVFAADELGWFERDLAGTNLPTLVFTHLPLDDGSMVGNFYFEKYFAGHAHYRNGNAAREIIERSGNVVACLAGHTHWNTRSTIDGVHYLTIQSLTESYTTHPHPAAAWALLRIADGALSLEVFGRDPVLCRLPVRKRGLHWVNLSRPYAPKPLQIAPGMQSRIARIDGASSAAAQAIARPSAQTQDP